MAEMRFYKQPHSSTILVTTRSSLVAPSSLRSMSFATVETAIVFKHNLEIDSWLKSFTSLITFIHLRISGTSFNTTLKSAGPLPHTRLPLIHEITGPTHQICHHFCNHCRCAILQLAKSQFFQRYVDYKLNYRSFSRSGNSPEGLCHKTDKAADRKLPD